MTAASHQKTGQRNGRPRCCAAGRDSGRCSRSPIREGSHTPRKSHWTWDRRNDVSPRGYGEARARGEMGSGSTHWGANSNHEGACHSPGTTVNQSVTLKILLERLGHQVLPLWDTARQLFTEPHAPCDPAVTPLGLRPQLAVLSKISEHFLLLKKKNRSECLWQFRL